MDDSKSPVDNSGIVESYSFRWTYIIFPAIVLLVSLILSAFFYQKLPADVACIFQSDGSPERWLGRGAVILWILGLQLIIVLAAGAVTWGTATIYNRYVEPDSAGIRSGRIISFMGNMVAMPQVIIFFTMLDIFSYNSYQVHLLPLWLVAVIALVVGGIVLGIFFIRASLQVWRANKE